MVWICLERFFSKTVKKLHAHNAGPFKILSRLNDNVCVKNLLKIFGISFTFDIEDLMVYEGHACNPSNLMLDKRLRESLCASTPKYLTQ